MPKLKDRRQVGRKGKRRHNDQARVKRWLFRTLIRRCGGACEYCGEPMVRRGDKDREATIDHVQPLSAGGLTVLANLRMCCRRCNQDKGAMSAEDWAAQQQ